MVKYTAALPEDSLGMKTSAIPKVDVSTAEWTTPTHVTGGTGYDPEDGMWRVKSNQKKWKVDFAGTSLNPAYFETVQQGAGQTIAVANGILTLGMGTTVNAETILLSKETFTIPVKTAFGINLSQKIANNEIWLELVSVDPVTGAVQAAVDLNTAAWKISGTDSTTNNYARYLVQAKGITLLDSGNVNTNVVHVAAWSLFEIEPFTDECWFHARIMDSSNGRSYSAVRHQNIPNPNNVYKIRIRIKNGAVAPASNTNVQFQFVNANDYAELTAEITAGRGNVAAGQAIGVQLTNSPYVNQSPGNDAYPWAMSPYPGLTQGRLDYARSQGNMEFATLNRRGATTFEKGVDLPVWQYVRYLPVAAGAGVTMVTDRRGSHRFIYMLFNVGSFWRYDTWTDSYQQLASPGALGGSGTWGAGTCMSFDPSQGTDGKIWLLTGYTTTAGFGVYDVATDVWTAKTVPTGAWINDAQMVHTDSTINAAGNDDFIYLFGNNGTTVKRYSIVGNAWTNMTAAPATIGAGAMAFWSYSQDTNSIYVFRGGGTSTLYAYSISANTWSTLTTVPSIETYNTGTCGAYMPDKNLYVFQKDNSHRIYAMDLATRKITPFGNAPYIGGTTVVGDGLFDIVTPDGKRFLYFRRHSSIELMRMMVHWI